MSESSVDIDSLIGRRRSWRLWLLLVAAVLVVGVGVGVYFYFRGGEVELAPEFQRVEAVEGELRTTVELSGTAAADRSSSLDFEASGVVVSVGVGAGDAVRAGDILATLDDSEIQSRIETAAVQLRLAQLQLEALLAGPGEADLASAIQAVSSAESQVISAEQALAELLEPVALSDIASAEQDVASAESQVISAEQALAELLEPVALSDIASAEQVVATALEQLLSAEEALAGLAEPPLASELASARQAVTDALGQVSSAEEALAALVGGPSEADVASGRSSVTQARAEVTSASDRADDSWHVLDEAFEEYCLRYDYLEVGGATCSASLPLAGDQVEALRDSLYEFSGDGTYFSYANNLMTANVAFIQEEAARQAAISALASAEEGLVELLEPASEEDLRQAELALEAAQASHTSAVARFEELQRTPTEGDVYEAEQAVEAARATYAAATARLKELLGPLDEGEIGLLNASLDSARSSLASAETRYGELLAGATANDIAQQEENVRLAEISLREAEAQLDSLRVVAPFDGVLEAVNVQENDRVSAGFIGFSLGTPDRIVIELTVTEADLLALEVGQTGGASFDAVEGVQYPVRIDSISRLPNAEQGVVTYDVTARILEGQEIREAAGEIPILGGGNAEAGFENQRLPGLRGGGRGGGRGGAAGLLGGLELPEGVTIQEIIEAMIAGAPLPEGVTLPEGLDVPPELLQRLAERGFGAAGEQRVQAQTAPSAARPLPAPGMSASVTILTEVREPAVLVPVSAVRQLEGAWFVTVPSVALGEEDRGFERVGVEIGESDGVSVEIISGIEAGTVLLIGADSGGIAFSATLNQQQPPEAGFRGGFPGRGRP